MTGRDERDAGRYRIVKATAIVLALVLVAPGADVVVRFAAQPSEAVAVSGGSGAIDSSELLDTRDVFGSLERIEGVAAAADAAVPEAFADEVGFLEGARDVRVSADDKVVGYVVDDDSESVLVRLVGLMEARGWKSVDLGEAQGCTFVKSGGSCTWALATCTQVGENTSVSVRCVIE